MNRPSLASAIVAQNTSMPMSAAVTTVATVSTAIAQALIAGHPVIIPGLGRLIPCTTAPRKGRNPRTPGVTIDIPARKTVKFKLAPALRQELNPAFLNPDGN